jgi:hypothetical protein
MDTNRISFRIICNDRKYLEESIDWYNSVNKTDFKIDNFILDEVNFAFITATKYSLTDIFNVGYAFGTKEQKLRSENKIDW